MDGKSYLPSRFDWMYLPAPSALFDEYLQPLFGYPQPQFGYSSSPCGCRLPAGSEREVVSSRISGIHNRTDIEDLKDSDKVLLPTRNLLLVVLGEDESEHSTPFTPLDQLSLHLYQGSAIEASVTRSLGVRIAVPAHVFRFPIASRTDWLSSSDRFPFNLW
jgi:hypothetical protein